MVKLTLRWTSSSLSTGRSDRGHLKHSLTFTHSGRGRTSDGRWDQRRGIWNVLIICLNTLKITALSPRLFPSNHTRNRTNFDVFLPLQKCTRLETILSQGTRYREKERLGVRVYRGDEVQGFSPCEYSVWGTPSPSLRRMTPEGRQRHYLLQSLGKRSGTLPPPHRRPGNTLQDTPRNLMSRQNDGSSKSRAKRMSRGVVAFVSKKILCCVKSEYPPPCKGGKSYRNWNVKNLIQVNNTGKGREDSVRTKSFFGTDEICYNNSHSIP